jgi:Protein of unknown function (DUF3833)
LALIVEASAAPDGDHDLLRHILCAPIIGTKAAHVSLHSRRKVREQPGDPRAAAPRNDRSNSRRQLFGAVASVQTLSTNLPFTYAGPSVHSSGASMKRLLALSCACALLLVGCSGMKLDDFAAGTPSLVLEDYFQGRTEAWGVFEDRFGRVRRQFKVDIDGRYEGRADDVVGAAIGEVRGNALRWQYDMQLPVGDRTWQVHFDDWMLPQNDGVLINRATVSRFGIALGQVTLFFRKS